MRKILLTIIIAFVGNIAISAQNKTNLDNEKELDSLSVADVQKYKADATEKAECQRHYEQTPPDSTRYIMMARQRIGNKAVKMPKYDAFSEKMKNDDWLGGLIKNILFR